ncbi:NadA autotransporter [Neisseria meningitidis 8013]|uniref:NadA autotransporter n=1 Tax=Neisseria meningitidis serogroup C (strain 8013) TaxID=604162 RepID=A0A9K2KQ33_NEIM8|nr:YadA C-terminal domain-containing protein [Neisseria meningitidis]CAX50956.1 NadA autotransporter [Neisseria meningitidis 8013]
MKHFPSKVLTTAILATFCSGALAATNDDDVKKAATVAIAAAYNNGQEINGFKAGETIYDIDEDGTITKKDATAADVEADDFKGLGLKKVVTNLTKTVNENKQNVDAKVKAAESEIEKLTTKLADTDAALADTDAALDATTNALNKLGENITTFAEETKTNIVKIDEKLEAVADTVDKHAEAFNDIADSLDETNTKADEAVKTANEAKQTAEETKQNVDAKVKAAETAAGKAEAAAGTANTAADKAEAVAAKVTDIKADIATNKDNIAKKANSADVYTREESDSKFVRIDGLNATTEKLDTRLASAEKSIAEHGTRLNGLDKTVSDLRKETRQGLAEQAALSGLFQPYNVGRFNVTAAVGGYKSESAVAIGTGFRFTENFAAKAGVAVGTSSGSSAAYHVGVNYEW